MQQIQISSTRQQQQQQHVQELNFQTRQKPKFEEFDEDEEEEEEYEVELDEDQKTSYTSSTTPHSRCSRGVSTDELDEAQAQKAHSSADDTPSITTASKNRAKQSNSGSQRFNEEDDPGVVSESESGPGRNSVLLQLIACGSSAVAKAKSSQPAAAKTGGSGSVLLRRGVLCKRAVKMADEEMISYMSENPRFGNPQAEDKEYFSGSIVESMTEERAGAATPVLKKSNSYNEERFVFLSFSFLLLFFSF